MKNYTGVLLYCLSAFFLGELSRGAEIDYPSESEAKILFEKENPLIARYEDGFGDYRDFKEIYKECSSKGAETDADKLYLRGKMILNGHAPGIEQAEALVYLKKADELGNVAATAELARIYLYGLLVPFSSEIASSYAERAMGRGVLLGYHVAIALQRVGILTNLQRSNDLVERLEQERHDLILEKCRQGSFQGWLNLLNEKVMGPERFRDFSGAAELGRALKESGPKKSGVSLCLALGADGKTKQAEVLAKKLMRDGSLSALAGVVNKDSFADFENRKSRRSQLKLCSEKGGYLTKSIGMSIQYAHAQKQGSKEETEILRSKLLKAFRHTVLSGSGGMIAQYRGLMGKEEWEMLPLAEQIKFTRALLLWDTPNERDVLSLMFLLAKSDSRAPIGELRTWAHYCVYHKITIPGAIYPNLPGEMVSDRGFGELKKRSEKGDMKATLACARYHNPFFQLNRDKGDSQKALQYYRGLGKELPEVFGEVIQMLIYESQQNLEEGLEELHSFAKRGVELGDPRSMVALAGFYFTPTKNTEWYRAANEMVGGADSQRAISLLERATSLGSREAVDFLVSLYQGKWTRDVKLDNQKLLHWCRRGRALGVPYSLGFLGTFYDPSSSRTRTAVVGGPDLEKAIEIYEEAVQAGSGWAAQRLGHMNFGHVDGLSENLHQAYHWFLIGQRLKDPLATAVLATFYLPEKESEYEEIEAVVGKLDPEKAARNVQVAIKMGNTYAMTVLAKYHLQGKLGERSSVEEGLRLFEKAAEKNHWAALRGLYEIYSPVTATSYPKATKFVGGSDAAKAITYLEKLLERKSGYACMRMGELIELGEHPSETEIKTALGWFERGFRYGTKKCARYHAACVGMRVGLVEEFGERSLAMIEEYVTVYPKDSGGWDAYAALLARSGRFEEAIKKEKRAIKEASKGFPEKIDAYKKHLKNYQQGKAWSE